MSYGRLKIPTNNYWHRKGLPVEMTVFHYTAWGSARSSARWFANDQARASAHVVIDRDGDQFECVPPEYASWHAGRAEMRLLSGEKTREVNRHTIGIELANYGLLQESNGEFFYEAGRELRKYDGPDPVYGELHFKDGHVVDGFWEPYPDAQIQSALEYLNRLAEDERFRTAATRCCGHEDLSIPLGRKIDPGPLFPWDRFSRVVANTISPAECG